MTVTGAAMSGDYDAFTQAYAADPLDPTRLLIPALGNSDPAARVAIAHRLLDDGADPTVLQGGNSTINVLLGQLAHDPEVEAPLLERLIAGGADINHQSHRGDAPIMQLVTATRISDEQMVPFYRVLLAQPTLDLEQRALPKGTDTQTIRERIFAPGGFVRRRLRAMIEERDVTD